MSIARGKRLKLQRGFVRFRGNRHRPGSGGAPHPTPESIVLVFSIPSPFYVKLA